MNYIDVDSIYSKQIKDLKSIRVLLSKLLKHESNKLSMDDVNVNETLQILTKVIPLQLKVMPLELQTIRAQEMDKISKIKDNPVSYKISDEDVNVLNEYLKDRLNKKK